MSSYTRKYGLVKRFEGGISAQPPVGSKETWSSSIPDNRVKPYMGELVEGGFVLLSPPDGLSVFDVLNAPLLDIRLSKGEVNKCPQPSELLMLGLQGAFRALAMMKTVDKSFTGLDKVGLEDYLSYWISNGARLGVREGDFIVWTDTGRKTRIPEFDMRFRADGEDDLTMAPSKIVVKWYVMKPNEYGWTDYEKRARIRFSVNGLRLADTIELPDDIADKAMKGQADDECVELLKDRLGREFDVEWQKLEDYDV